MKGLDHIVKLFTMVEVEKMNNALLHFEKELTSRTSRASPNMLDNITVDAYGSKTPLNQLGNISIPDTSTITIQIWDNSLIKQIESAITDPNLGINPQQMVNHKTNTKA